ncbi:MAG: chorismate lyase [Pseudomonadota bacterium]
MQIDWQDKSNVTAEIDQELIRKLLFYDGSLTRYLQSICAEDFSIKVQSESWGLLFKDECLSLKLEDNQKAFIRLSHLNSGAKTMVYARTVFPEKTYKLIKNKLEALGERPLGELLFSEPSAYRSQMKYAKIRVDSKLFLPVKNQEPEDSLHWARQSLFMIDEMPLLITELFLPAISQCIK